MNEKRGTLKEGPKNGPNLEEKLGPKMGQKIAPKMVPKMAPNRHGTKHGTESWTENVNRKHFRSTFSVHRIIAENSTRHFRSTFFSLLELSISHPSHPVMRWPNEPPFPTIPLTLRIYPQTEFTI